MQKILFYTLIIIFVLLFQGCGQGTHAHSCGNGCTEEKVLALSDCGGFSDRKQSDINFSGVKTYISYDFNDRKKILTLTHYNAAIACDANFSQNAINAGWLGPISIKYGTSLIYNKSCYCLRDIKTEIKLKKPAKKYTEYTIEISDKQKGELDPIIHFVIDIDHNKTGVVSFDRTGSPWKSCETPTLLQSHIDQNGIRLDLNVSRCEKENQPLKIKTAVTNNNNYPVLYKILYNDNPSIDTIVTNTDFLLSKLNDHNYLGDSSISYATIQAGEMITRQSNWNNTLASGLIAPNGDYNITSKLHYVGNADLIDINNPIDSSPIYTSISITKNHSKNLIKPIEIFDKILEDAEIKSWLDAHENIYCYYQNSFIMQYNNGQWLKSEYTDNHDINRQQSESCHVGLSSYEFYYFKGYSKYYFKHNISKKVNALI